MLIVAKIPSEISNSFIANKFKALVALFQHLQQEIKYPAVKSNYENML
jgi:hypothetical protein